MQESTFVNKQICK